MPSFKYTQYAFSLLNVFETGVSFFAVLPLSFFICKMEYYLIGYWELNEFKGLKNKSKIMWLNMSHSNSNFIKCFILILRATYFPWLWGHQYEYWVSLYALSLYPRQCGRKHLVGGKPVFENKIWRKAHASPSWEASVGHNILTAYFTGFILDRLYINQILTHKSILFKELTWGIIPQSEGMAFYKITIPLKDIQNFD